MSARLQRRLVQLMCLILLITGFTPAMGQQGKGQVKSPAASKAAAARPRLVVGIVIDQFRFDYLERFEDQFGPGGFKRFLNSGSVFANANYLHTPTYTACGHATFMSGTTPSMNGIIGNDWFDRESGKRITSVSDSTVKLLGGREGATGMSPVRLIGSTLGDEIKRASMGRSKVVGVSLKDRAAILPAGKRPDGAYWFDANTGNLVSSTYYFKDLPDWVKSFNREMRPDRFFGKKWEKLLPEAAYNRSTADDMAFEKSSVGNKFPYTINGGEEKPGSRFYNQFELSPFANDYLVDFAKTAIVNEKLGTDDDTDLLTISFSSNDLIGHSYGPYSQEVQDVTLRTDRAIAELFSYLDKKIGLDKVVVVLTADHGVAPVPEQVRELGYGGRLEIKPVTDAIESALDKRFEDDKWILSAVNGNIYFDESVIERRKASMHEVEQIACQVIMKQPGMAECLTRTQLMGNNIPLNMIARSVANGFHSGRNGNIIMVTLPYYFFGEGVTTTHGSPYSYDTHVPVLFYGWGIGAGTFYDACSPADIAPTLSALLKVEPPSNSTGRVLSEAFRKK